MGFANQPKILRGAFVEFGISLPPLIVVFQFNPVTISRAAAPTRTSHTPESARARRTPASSTGEGEPKSLIEFRNGQTITVGPETLSFDIRLDATDKLNEGDTLTEQFGIAPQLSTLELMMLPKGQSLLGGACGRCSEASQELRVLRWRRDPPMMLFIWGRKKVLPVNIMNMQIREEEFSTDLNPTRAMVTVSLEVIEGPNAPFLYTKGVKEVMSLLNLANIGDVANTMVPR